MDEQRKRRLLSGTARVTALVTWLRGALDRVPGAVWGIIALFSLAVFVVCALGIWFRALRPDPAVLGFTASVAQVLAVLLALASLLGLQMAWGQQVMQRLQAWLTARKLALGLTLAAIVAASVFQIGLPAWAKAENDQGVVAFAENRTDAALRHFRQAVSLDPDYAQAHYNLGNTYENLLDFDRAIYEYRIALEQDIGFYPAYNNLARLYIQEKKAYDQAILLLREALKRAEDEDARSVIYKNLGWAHYEKGLYELALTELSQALALRLALETGQANPTLKLYEVYGRLGRVYEKLGNTEEAERVWLNCLGYAEAEDSPEAQEWAAEARQHLAALGGGR